MVLKSVGGVLLWLLFLLHMVESTAPQPPETSSRDPKRPSGAINLSHALSPGNLIQRSFEKTESVVFLSRVTFCSFSVSKCLKKAGRIGRNPMMSLKNPKKSGSLLRLSRRATSVSCGVDRWQRP